MKAGRIAVIAFDGHCRTLSGWHSDCEVGDSVTTCPQCGQDAYEYFRCRKCGADDLPEIVVRGGARAEEPSGHEPMKQVGIYDLVGAQRRGLPLAVVSPEAVAFDRKYQRFLFTGFLLYVLALAARWLIGQLW